MKKTSLFIVAVGACCSLFLGCSSISGDSKENAAALLLLQQVMSADSRVVIDIPKGVVQ